MKRRGLLALGFLIAASGCGYHVGGHADLMPRTLKTIAVPAFENGTTRYKLARLLPGDITREFLTRTKYSIVSDPRQAEAVLEGRLTNFVAWPVITDPVSNRATAVQVIVTLNLTLREISTGKILFMRNGAEFRERYEIALDPNAYFDESGTAVERVSRNVARTVVSAVMEAF